MRTAISQALTPARQHGAALLVMLLIMIVGAAYLLVSQLNRASGRIEADRKTSEALAQAKEALIGWAVGYGAATGTATAPGMLPYPDGNNDPLGYDGLSDCYTGVLPIPTQQLLGKVPRVGTGVPCPAPQTALSIDAVDGAGEVLWYAVSRNLVSLSGSAPINPNLLLPATATFPPFPWLRVRNADGTILNDRIAFLIIAPGAVVGTQNRAGFAPAANQFLDRYTVASSGITYSNADFNGSDDGLPCVPTSPYCEDFIQGDPLSPNNSFNDRLLYVTIDELMPLIEQRVAREVRQALRNFAPLPPAAAALGYLGDDCGSAEGFLPLPTCECRLNGTNLSCDCPFDTPPTASITYTGSAGFTVPVNGCALTPLASCQCTRAGSCTGPAQTFRCSADGACTATNVTPANFSIAYRLPALAIGGFSSATKNPATAPNCTITPLITNTTMSCSNFMEAQGIVGGCLPGRILTGLPDWLLSSGWKHYMYYATSNALPFLTVGTANDIRAVVISVGRPLAIDAPPALQTRPSSSVADYLDSAVNRSVAPDYSGVGQPLTNTFNDQAVIVAP